MPDELTIPRSGEEREARPGSYAGRFRFWAGWRPYLAALAAGGLLACAFPPLAWAWLPWFGLVVPLVIGLRSGAKPGLAGYCFGVGHFTLSFAWLRTIFLPIPLLIALVWAFLIAAWLVLVVALVRNLTRSPEVELLPRTDPRFQVEARLSAPHQALVVIASASIWCTFEWVRMWAFSGFPWNQIGISQWQTSALLPVTTFTGVYGISFVIVAVNTAVALQLHSRTSDPTRPWLDRAAFTGLGTAAALIVAVLCVPAPAMTEAAHTLRAAAVQGNIPLARQWQRDQLTKAVSTYTALTLDAVKDEQPDLVVWPETAIPASLTHHTDTRAAVGQLSRKIKTPLLAGSITFSLEPGTDDFGSAVIYNTALLYNVDGEIVDRYHKIHIVPYGEYVPFEQWVPEGILHLVSMGRSLSPGTEYTVFSFDDHTRIGVNICYEDVFPEISRQFVRRGANVLMTITNDAWFLKTSGSRQHLSHAVFRAVENNRPLLRSGNNSDTCLILADGTITGLLVDPDTGDPFTEAVGFYDIPVSDDTSLTYYTKHGDRFAHATVLVTVLATLFCMARWLSRKKRLHDMVQQGVSPTF